MSKRTYCTFFLSVLLTCYFSSIAFALEKTPTGFYYPMNSFTYSNSGYWLGPGLGTAGPHGHIGVDMLASENTPVYAIADGFVENISKNGWGEGNVAVLVRHHISDGRFFIALYGHLSEKYGVVSKGTKVIAGKTVIGKLGPYFTSPHLHFGIVSPGKKPGATYGYTNASASLLKKS